MLVKIFIILFLPVCFLSCFSLSIDKEVEIDRNEDWLLIGGDSLKSNISKSESRLEPPFNLYWEYDVDGGLARNCLSASDAILFVNTLNGEFYALDVTTGKSLGRTSTGRSSFSTPLVYRNNIILTSSSEKDSRIQSYNLISGIYKWQRNIGPVESSPILINDNNILAASMNGKVYNLNVSTGSIVWTTDRVIYNNYYGAFYTSPTVSNDLVLVGNIDGNVYAFSLLNGEEVWKFKTGASVKCDVSVNNNRLYFGSDDKNFYCLDTSGNMLWKNDLRSKVLSSSTFYEDLVIFSAVDGNVYALNKDSGNVVWKFATKGVLEASPLLHGDKIFIGSYDRNFYCISAMDGEELWKYECEGRIRTSAVIWKDYIFTASDERYVYCFSNKEIPKSSTGGKQ